MAARESIGECLLCNGPILPSLNKDGSQRKGTKKYCSLSCLKRAGSRRYEKVRPKRKRLSGKPGRGPIVSSHCPSCGMAFSRQRSSSKDQAIYCNQDCAKAARKRVSDERAALLEIQANWLTPVSRRLRASVQMECLSLRRMASYSSSGRKTVRPCASCGAKAAGIGERRRVCVGCKSEAVQAYRKRWRTTESGKADRRAYKARRRARLIGVRADSIDPIKVFQNDGWRCHLCGVRTPRKLRGSFEPTAPELDHVIPLAAGGAHLWENVRCCCRSCNIAKGARPLGQMGLRIGAGELNISRGT